MSSFSRANDQSDRFCARYTPSSHHHFSCHGTCEHIHIFSVQVLSKYVRTDHDVLAIENTNTFGRELAPCRYPTIDNTSTFGRELAPCRYPAIDNTSTFGRKLAP